MSQSLPQTPAWRIVPFKAEHLKVGVMVASTDGKWGVVTEVLSSGLPVNTTKHRCWVDFGSHLTCVPFRPGVGHSDYRLLFPNDRPRDI